MGTTVRVVGGRHRRPDGTVFDTGEVFEATDDELEAFGDKFEVLDDVEVEYETAESESEVPPDAGAGEYRLARGGTHRTRDEDGNIVVLEEGDVAHLDASEVEAFGDKFEPVESEDEADDSAETTEDESDETEAADGDEFDVDEFLEQNVPEAADAIQDGDVDAHLETIGEETDRVGIEDAVEDRQDELEG